MGTWTLDPLHTQVEFSAKHFGMMTVRGHFAELTATGDIHPEKAETKINRKDFGMNFDAMANGKFVVSHDIQINIEGELVEVEKKVEAGATSNRAGTTSAP